MTAGPLTVPYLLGCQTQRVAYLRYALQRIEREAHSNRDWQMLAYVAAEALMADDAAQPITDEVSP